MHSTNYTNTFIAVADDCKAKDGTVPPEKQKKTIARMHYDLIHDNPYQYTSDEVVFAVYAARTGIEPADMEAERAAFFSKGQPCLRSSPLGKTYGWGIHSNDEAKVALYPRGSKEYAQMQTDSALKQIKAMRSTK